MYRILSAGLAISTLILSGCADISSSDIRTSGICADIDIFNSNNRVQIDTTLKAGCGLGGSYVDLDGNDYLSANYLSGDYILNKHSEFLSNITSYHATSTTNYTAGEQVYVKLNRDSTSVSADNSFVNLLSPFTLTQPVNNSTYSSGQSISFSWDRSQPGSSVYLQLECNKSDGSNTTAKIYRTTSSTAYTIGVSEVYNVLYTPGEATPLNCSGTANVKQHLAGNIDPAYENGSRITSSYLQSRNISINF
ncbi:MAG: hypothetical protein OEX03_11870 [Gammaproteobacteria bacterium]|nr:hypothetical protein [Gammaproteobacteria bacterium]